MVDSGSGNERSDGMADTADLSPQQVQDLSVAVMAAVAMQRMNAKPSKAMNRKLELASAAATLAGEDMVGWAHSRYRACGV